MEINFKSELYLEAADGDEAAGGGGVHLVLGVALHGDPLRRPVLNVAGAVDHRKVVPCGIKFGEISDKS